MSNNKQSSIDWLHVEFQKRFPKETYEMYNNNQLLYEQIIEQAKAMHKEEIKNSWGNGWANGDVDIDYFESVQEKYYNEKFGGNDEQ